MKAFTLIELLVVIVIIGILATISVATFSGYFEKARHAKRQADLNQIATAFRQYVAFNGNFPNAPTEGACIGLNDNEYCWGDLNAEGNTQLNNELNPYLQTSAFDPDPASTGWGDNYFYYSGQISIGCRVVVPSDPIGEWVLWRHPNMLNGFDCKGAGIFSCCSGTPFCSSAGGYFCAYPISREQ